MKPSERSGITIHLAGDEYARWLTIFGIDIMAEPTIYPADLVEIEQYLRYVIYEVPPYPQNEANALFKDHRGNVIGIADMKIMQNPDKERWVKVYGIRAIPMGHGHGEEILDYILNELGISIEGDSVYQAVDFWDRMGVEWMVRKPDITSDNPNQNTRFFLRAPKHRR